MRQELASRGHTPVPALVCTGRGSGRGGQARRSGSVQRTPRSLPTIKHSSSLASNALVLLRPFLRSQCHSRQPCCCLHCAEPTTGSRRIRATPAALPLTYHKVQRWLKAAEQHQRGFHTVLLLLLGHNRIVGAVPSVLCSSSPRVARTKLTAGAGAAASSPAQQALTGTSCDKWQHTHAQGTQDSDHKPASHSLPIS